MPLKYIVAVFAIALVAQAGLAAPGVMNSAPPQDAGGQGFWSKLWRGDDPPQQPTPSVSAQPADNQGGWWSSMTGKPSTAAAPFEPLAAQATGGELAPKAWVLKAQLAEAQGDHAGARDCLSRALAQAPNDPATLREIGHFEDRREQLGLAAQMYQRALAAAPRDTALLNDLALCYARQGRLQESAQLLSKAISLRPEKTLYRNNLAKVLVELGQPEAALSQLVATHPPAVAQYNLGVLLEAKGDLAAATHCYREATRLDPTLNAANAALRAATPAANAAGLQLAQAPARAQQSQATATTQPGAATAAPVSQPQSEPLYAPAPYYPATGTTADGPVLALPPLE